MRLRDDIAMIVKSYRDSDQPAWHTAEAILGVLREKGNEEYPGEKPYVTGEDGGWFEVYVPEGDWFALDLREYPSDYPPGELL